MLDTFRPLLDAACGLELCDPARAERELCRILDPRGAAARALNDALRGLLDAGRIADRGAPPVRWSRVCKATPETHELSIDAVDMTGAGPEHRHPEGEIDYAVALEGRPTFDGRPPGWIVFGPGSVHVPTVAGGRMLIVYLLPHGAMEFLGRA